MKKKRYILGEIRLRPDEPEEIIPKKIAKKLRINRKEIQDVQVVRRSVDARRKPDVRIVYTAEFSCRRNLPVDRAKPKKPVLPVHGNRIMKGRPVIAGFGPCGMFAALTLARQGYRPLVLERGGTIEERVRKVDAFWKEGILDPECNVQFGEGGAGTFSDGKLTTGIRDPRTRTVLEEFVRAGAPEDILIDRKPHIGTDILRTAVKNLREEIRKCGGEIRFSTRFSEIGIEKGQVTSVIAEGPEGKEEFPTEIFVLAVGHSARDTFRELQRENIPMEAKPFSIGVRIEHPQSLIDHAQYGGAEKNWPLPPADYKLSWHGKNGRGVYTFCMCPGGEVIISSSSPGETVTNGMSNSRRDSGKANSALLVDVRVSDFSDPEDPLSGVDFQRKYEQLAFQNGGKNYQPPQTIWRDFRDGTDKADPVISSLPEFVVEAIREAMPQFGKKLSGFDRDDALIRAVESRSSSPVRILRGKDMMTQVKGLYPGGEGAGYAGGIMSSAVDGIRIAEQIIKEFSPEAERTDKEREVFYGGE